MSVVYIGEMVEDFGTASMVDMGRGVERYTPEEEGLLELNEGLQSDIVADAILEAGDNGVVFGREFSHIKTRVGVASYLLEAFVDIGKEDIADYWQGNFAAA